MKAFHITDIGHGDYEVRFDYSASAVATIKELITPAFRTWDPDRKVWTVTGRTRVMGLASALRTLGYRGEVPEPPQPKVIQPTIGQHLLAVIRGIGPAYRSKVLRTLAAGAHPDAGGDGELSREVNRLREQVDR